MKEKQCTTCGLTKSVNEFYRRVDTKDGFRNTCKKCSTWNKDYKANLASIMDKTCASCSVVKPIEQFIPDDRTALGYGISCLICASKKLCRKCQIKKDVSEFPTSNASKDGYRYHCKSCTNEKRREKYNTDEIYREKILRRNYGYIHKKDSRSGRRERLLQTKYNLTLDDYENLLLEQDGRCKVCKCLPGERGRTYLAVDHDHKTGKIRGLLCDPCNRAIGMFKEDIGILQSAIQYLMAAHFG